MKFKPLPPVFRLGGIIVLFILTIKSIFSAIRTGDDSFFMTGILYFTVAALLIGWINKEFQSIQITTVITRHGFFFGSRVIDLKEISGYKSIKNTSRNLGRDWDIVIINQQNEDLFTTARLDMKTFNLLQTELNKIGINKLEIPSV